MKLSIESDDILLELCLLPLDLAENLYLAEEKEGLTFYIPIKKQERCIIIEIQELDSSEFAIFNYFLFSTRRFPDTISTISDETFSPTLFETESGLIEHVDFYNVSGTSFFLYSSIDICAIVRRNNDKCRVVAIPSHFVRPKCFTLENNKRSLSRFLHGW
jgi:hypothetical protein